MRGTGRFAIASLALAPALGAFAAAQLLKLPFPGPAEPPFYTASIAPYFDSGGNLFAVHDGEWAVISFARPISIVPPHHNLLEPDFAVFGQPMTMRGFALFETFPGPPTMSQARGDGSVPVWFMRWNELQGAVADLNLTLAELEALPSLRRGSASYYQEQNHFANHQVSHLAAVARGTLEGGGRFRLQVVEVALGLPQVTIKFE